MAELTTTHFGTIHFEPEDVLTFPAGLPGFWHATQFLLLPHRTNSSIRYLQSAEVPSLRFILVAAMNVMPHYELAIEPFDIRYLLPPGEASSQEALRFSELNVWFVISTPTPDSLTVNLLAPVVIAPKSRQGVQAVRSDTRYSHQFPLAPATLEARTPVC